MINKVLAPNFILVRELECVSSKEPDRKIYTWKFKGSPILINTNVISSITETEIHDTTYIAINNIYQGNDPGIKTNPRKYLQISIIKDSNMSENRLYCILEENYEG